MYINKVNTNINKTNMPDHSITNCLTQQFDICLITGVAFYLSKYTREAQTWYLFNKAANFCGLTRPIQYVTNVAGKKASFLKGGDLPLAKNKTKRNEVKQITLRGPGTTLLTCGIIAITVITKTLGYQKQNIQITK